MSSRALIIVFDALRPEFLTPELMPNLHAFAARGVRCLNSRSTFPTETRVNQSAVTTGCLPRRHGIVGNKFVADDLQAGLLVNSGDDDMLASAFEAGPVLNVPSLGQRLTEAGRRFVSLSAGTPGGGRLINWSAERDGSHRLAMRNPDACCPPGFFDDIVRAVGPLPAYDLPARDWISWAVAAYLDHVDPALSPDVMLLWLCEPDESFHWKDIGSDASRDTIRHADAEFGRILHRHADALAQGGMQIIALSDHGQISVTGEALDLVGRFADAGLRASRKSMEGADCVISVANAGGIWVRDRDPALVERIVSFLLGQDWCGPLFTRDGVLGTLTQDLVMIDHARAPDISLVLRSGPEANRHGIAGTSLHDSPYPPGGGCHGGLSRWELENVMMMGGTAFRANAEVTAPCNNADILPTLFEALGLAVPDGLDGRVLSEAMAGGQETVEAVPEVHRSTNAAGPVTVLHRTRVGDRQYLDQARVE